MRFRHLIPLIAFLPLHVLSGCVIAKSTGSGRAVQSTRAHQPATEFYRGDVSLRHRGRRVVSPVILQLVTFMGENRMELTLHQKVKGVVKEVVFDLERIGMTDVFFITDRGRTVQGRVRFSGGPDWKWNQWAIGLTNSDRTAIAGAMVRDPATANFRLKLQATSDQGKQLEEATGELRFVTEETYVATLDAWKKGLRASSE